MKDNIFSGPEVYDLCESIMEIHRALKTIGMIYNNIDFETDNGNAFQGKIRQAWFKSVIDEMIMTQFEKLNQIVDIYNLEQAKLSGINVDTGSGINNDVKPLIL